MPWFQPVAPPARRASERTVRFPHERGVGHHLARPVAPGMAACDPGQAVDQQVAFAAPRDELLPEAIETHVRRSAGDALGGHGASAPMRQLRLDVFADVRGEVRMMEKRYALAAQHTRDLAEIAVDHVLLDVDQ